MLPHRVFSYPFSGGQAYGPVAAQNKIEGVQRMAAPKKGRRAPTQAITLPYAKTHGQEAIDLYNATGRTAQEWRELPVYDILAENNGGLWVHTKFGYSLPRRNGKNPPVRV